MSFSEDLISILGKATSAAEVVDVVNRYGLRDVYDDPPFRRYVGSSEKGVDLLFENEKVLDIQIYAQRSQTHMPFPVELPFGIKAGMTDKQIHALLGEPEIRDSIGSKYTALEGLAKLTIVYDKSNVVSYVSIRGL
ncbi:hypothetical protein B0G57_10810 [Trinickia symbiotica]|uniref:hypothetical protein n=1 Tax=Trinickia symbiotica TaxID=863227 RepID=UPI0005524D9D|nr:hypothetical protein [Trinickia symbiotica]PPK44430.1 hypothetical protein B0G57_10810 [Trinickia symbiotica]